MDKEGKMTKNLLKLPIEEKERFFDSFDMVQTDCDGVLWLLGEPFDGVERSIRALRTNGKRVVFVSNNSVRTMEDYRAKLYKLTDHTVDDEDVIHPAKIVIQYLRERKFDDALCYVIGSTNFKNCLREAGIQIIDGPDEPVPEAIKAVAAVINDGQPVKAVIVDFDYNMNNIKLLRAQLYLQHDALFIAGAMDTVLPVGRMRLIGPGCYVEVLEKIADRKPIVLGKPGREMSKMLKQRYAIDNPRRVLFVGDQPEMDVQFGHISNYQTLLVGTGGVKEDDLKQLASTPSMVPDYYIDSFAGLEQFVRDVMVYKARNGEKSGP
ncbi:uncharacterized protein LOC125775136 [Anopheles funestus]|uniref:4-nitrophenylphosphatase n=1 Tax=Anopheles funestus TaxID=62324 RepID=A0A182RWR4_ANOFN|nr:uncharacterized protein LOC125775136 [Anopheles funestus]